MGLTPDHDPDPAQVALDSLAATAELASALAAVLRPGDVLALTGDLGAGKTTLVQGIARAWGLADGEARSPTFALMNVHELPDFDLVHADLYRLTDADEVAGTGLTELLGAPDCVCVLEWPDAAAPWLPATTLRLTLSTTPARTATPGPRLAARLKGQTGLL